MKPITPRTTARSVRRSPGGPGRCRRAPLPLCVGIDRLVLLGAGLAGAIHGAEWHEDFSRAPADNGWATFGEADLFNWDADREALRVTWDSAQPNSYLWRPLGTVLSRADDFGFGFEIELDHVAVGGNPAKPHTFELAVGLHRHADATTPAFRRGNAQCPNLVELAYFPDSGYGATVWPTVVAANGRFNWSGANDFLLLELEPGSRYQLGIEFSAADSRLALNLKRDGIPVDGIPPVTLSPQFTDFRVDTFAVRSYSDDGADGSLFATGWIDEVRLRLPPPPVEGIQGRWEAGTWKVSFAGRTGWRYQLQRRVLPDAWQDVGGKTDGEARTLELTDPEPLPGTSLYRVAADKP